MSRTYHIEPCSSSMAGIWAREWGILGKNTTTLRNSAWGILIFDRPQTKFIVHEGILNYQGPKWVCFLLSSLLILSFYLVPLLWLFGQWKRRILFAHTSSWLLTKSLTEGLMLYTSQHHPGMKFMITSVNIFVNIVEYIKYQVEAPIAR
jgi:hypothetical protein